MGAEKLIARLIKGDENSNDVDVRDVKFVALDRDLYDTIVSNLGYDDSNVPDRDILDQQISTFIRLLMQRSG